MTRLVWDQPGEHYYQTGVDRGVFYPTSGPGVPWNGLVTVGHGTTGGSLSAVYVDGKIVRMDIGSEDYAGSIKAFSAPSEFGPCEGIVHIAKGLHITAQPKAEFGFSYRTLLGNDVSPDLGYKIHFVYNAKAEPASRENATKTNTTSPLVLTWGITARPIAVPGHKPAAHYMVDTTRKAPSVIAALENILYGSEGVDPRLPTTAEIFALV